MTSTTGPDISPDVSPDFTERQSKDFDTQRLAYAHKPMRRRKPHRRNFLRWFPLDMGGTKALALASWAAERKQNFVRFDYFGHGSSTGEFTEGTISHWRGTFPIFSTR